MKIPLRAKSDLGVMAIKKLFHIPKNATTPETPQALPKDTV